VTITSVVQGFAAALPEAAIYVFDNNSTDDTARHAADAGAIVRHEGYQGKGFVVRRMFADIDADVYVMADGDGTYEPTTAVRMIELLIQGQLDMVVGKREADKPDAAFRTGHRLGNHLMTRFVARLFGERFSDIFSGYRVMSRRFVKSYPALATGFEIETELTIHALQLGLPVAEVATPYYPRPQGSVSKLSTFGDGSLILWAIMQLYKDVRPFRFFGTAGVLLMALSLALAWPLFLTYFETGLVPRFPTAILATGTTLLAFLSLACGVILDSVSRGRLETKRLAYLRAGPAG
jgi:glycosyltransferase involved in cell wall biosynthesis